MSIDYYGFDGEPIDQNTWMMMFDSPARIVAQIEIGDVWISTVWLGLDHGFGHTDAPLIYETMVFDRERDATEMRRYSTLAEAQAGHDALVEQFETLARALDSETPRHPG